MLTKVIEPFLLQMCDGQFILIASLNGVICENAQTKCIQENSNFSQQHDQNLSTKFPPILE